MKNIETGKNTNRLLGADDSMLKNFPKILPFLIIGIVCFCVYYLLNINTPPFGDDIFMMFKNPDLNAVKINAQKISSIKDIIVGLVSYYLGYRGRVIAEGLEIIFAVYGKQYFNFFNSLVFVGITSLVYFHSNYGKKTNWRLYLIVCVVFWFLTPNLTNTTLWMVASLDTFWPIFFILLFLVPYRILVSEKGEVKSSVLATLFVIPIGFIAGAFNEQSFGLSIGFVVLTIIALKIKKRSVPVWSIIGLFSTICGTISLFLSPGYRNNSLGKYGGTPTVLFLHNFQNRIFGAANYSFRVTRVLLLLTAIVCIWLIVDSRKTAKSIPKKKKKKKKKKQTEHSFFFKSFVDNNGLLIPGLFFITTVGSVVIASALPYFDYRLFFTVFVSFALVFFSLLAETINRIEFSKSRLNNVCSTRYMRIAIPVLISLIAVLDFGKEYRIYHQNFEVYTEVVASIKEEIADGKKNIVIHNKTEIPQMLLPEGRLRSIIYDWTITSLTDDTNAPLNKWYAYYLGAHTLKGEIKDTFNKKDGISPDY